MTSPYILDLAQALLPEVMVRTIKYGLSIIFQANDTGSIYSYDTSTSTFKYFDSSVNKEEVLSFFSSGGN